MKLGTVGVNLGNVEAYRAALKGLSVEQSVFALASKGATEEQIRQILVTDQAKLKDVEAAMAKAGLTTATKALNAEELIALATKKGISAERAKEIASALGLIATEKGQVVSKKQLTVATLQQVGATDAEITAILGLNAAETANIGITNVLTASFAKLWAVITAHPIGAILTAIGVVAVSAVAAYNKWGDTLENTKEKLSDLKSECQEIVSDLQAVNSELETTQQRLEELEGKDTLTFTEKEEYDNLVKINNELQRKIDLLELEEKNKRKEQNKTFVSVMEKDTEDPFEHEVNPDGKKPAGQYSISDEYLTSETGYIEAQFEIRDQLLEDLANAETEKEKERIQKRIDEIDKYLNDKNDEWKNVSDGIDYIENPTTEDDKAVNEWLDYIADFQDRMAIAMSKDDASSNAQYKTNTFNRVVDNWQFDETVQGLQDLGKEGKVTAEMLDDPKYDDFINKLVFLGVIDSADNLEDVALAFNSVATSAENAADSASKYTDKTDISNLFDIDFSTQKDTIDDFQSKIQSLGDTYAKVLNGNYTGSELIDMLQELKEAGADLSDIDSLDELGDAINNIKVDVIDDLISSLNIDPDSGLAAYLSSVADEAINVKSALEGVTNSLSGIQNGYSTVTKALKEYNENGYLTIDTLNSILTLEPEYLSCLIDENGQLSLNKTAYENLAKAQINKAKQAVIDEAMVKLNQLAHEKLATSTDEASDSVKAFIEKIKTGINKLKDYTQNIWNTISAKLGLIKANALEKYTSDFTDASGDVSNEELKNKREQAKAAYKEALKINEDAAKEIWSDMNTKLSFISDFEKNIGDALDSSTSSSKSDSTSTSSFDWIERKITTINNAIDTLKAKLANAFTVKKKNSIIDEEINKSKELLTVYKNAENKYSSLASSYASQNANVLTSGMIAKIQSGDYSIEEYDSDTANIINTYKDLWDKSKEAAKSYEEEVANIRDLQKEKNTNKQNYADGVIEALEAQKETVTTVKKKNKYLQDERKYIKQSYDAQIDNAKIKKNKYLIKKLEAGKDKELLDNQIEQYQNFADKYDSLVDLYESKANSTTSAKKKNKYLEKELSQLKSSYNYQIRIANKSGYYNKAAQLRLEYEQKILDVMKQQLENIQAQADSKISYNNAKVENSSNKSKKKLFNSNAESYEKANDDIREYLTSKDFKTDISSATRSEMKASYGKNTSAYKSLTTAMKKAGLSQSLIAKIQGYLAAGKKIPDSILAKVKKADTNLYNKLVKYNKDYSNNYKENKDEITSEAKTKIEQNKASAREERVKATQIDVDSAQSKLDLYESKYNNLSTAKNKNKNLDKQISARTNVYEAEKLKLLAEYTDENGKIIDQKEYQLELSKLQAQYETDIRNKEIEKKQNLADEAEANYNLLQTQEELATSASDKNKIERKSLEYLKTQYDNLIAIAEAEGNAAEAARLRAESEKAISDSQLKQFNNIKEEYDYAISAIEHENNLLDSAISMSQSKGFISYSKYYNKQKELANDKLITQEKKLEELQEELANNKDKLTADEYKQAQKDIWDAQDAIEATKLEIIETGNALRDLDWSNFELGQSYISKLVEESDFLIELLGENDLFNDDGSFTNKGLSVSGLYAQNYGTYMEQALDYGKKAKETWEGLETSYLLDGEYDTKAIEQYQKYISLQQGAIKNAKAQKEAIKDLISDGYDKLSESLNDVISKYVEALDAGKDLYSYQNSLQEKMDNLASLQKQFVAMSGNETEENQSDLQKIASEIKDAEKDIQETEYDQYISDQKKMLDTLQDEVESWINARLDNIDGLLEKIIEQSNGNTSVIKETLKTTASSVGYELSETFEKIWDSNDVPSLSSYTNGVADFSNAVSNATISIKDFIKLLETPPVEAPPVETPPVEAPPVEAPVVETPPVESPPETPPVVETPPMESPPESLVAPPMESPVVETPTVDDHYNARQEAAYANAMEFLRSEYGNNSNQLKHIETYYKSLGIQGVLQALRDVKASKKILYTFKWLAGLEGSEEEAMDFLRETYKNDDDALFLINNKNNGFGYMLSVLENQHKASDETINVAKWLAGLSSFAVGGHNIKDEFGWVDENGSNEFIRTADGAILTKVRGATIFDQAHTDASWKLADELLKGRNVFSNMYQPYITPSINRNISQGDVTINMGGIIMNEVNDPETFSKNLINSLNNDTKVKKTLDTRITNGMLNKNSLSSRRYM